MCVEDEEAGNGDSTSIDEDHANGDPTLVDDAPMNRDDADMQDYSDDIFEALDTEIRADTVADNVLQDGDAAFDEDNEDDQTRDNFGNAVQVVEVDELNKV